MGKTVILVTVLPAENLSNSMPRLVMRKGKPLGGSVYFKERSDIPSRLLHVVMEFAFSHAGGLRVHNDLLDDKTQTGEDRGVVFILVSIPPDRGGVESMYSVHKTDLQDQTSCKNFFFSLQK